MWIAGLHWVNLRLAERAMNRSISLVPFILIWSMICQARWENTADVTRCLTPKYLLPAWRSLESGINPVLSLMMTRAE
ncbi:hypothetical protein D3C73_478080 [compost metagenome]